MEKIRRLAKRIVEGTDRKSVLDYVVDLAVEMTGAERGLLVMSKGKKVVFESARNLDRESLRGREARLSLTIARHAMEQQSTLLIEDAKNQDMFALAESVYELGLRSVLCCPVWLSGEVVGGLYVDSRFIAGAFGQQDAQTVETLAEFAGLFLWKLGVEVEKAESVRTAEAKGEEVVRLEEQLEELNRLCMGGGEQSGKAGGKSSSSFPRIIGQSPAMEAVYAIIDKVLDNDITVLIQGESGTGKELVARAIHDYGRRKDRMFVAINCSSIPATLIESEVFGHLKGAFTGATKDKKGLFEVANDGTLFLDEVGDMPMEMQGKLLRALQYGEIQRLGSVHTKKVDVRVLAATNRKMDELVAKGLFREDLYYRLNIVTVEVPPLRRRRDDIPLLVQHFMEENRKQGIASIEGITPRALMVLSKYPWPGNVRELETIVKSACLFAEGSHLDAGDFEALTRGDGLLLESSDPTYFEGKTLAEVEKDVIIATLNKNDGNKKRTAQELGIDRRTLYNKLKLYGMM